VPSAKAKALIAIGAGVTVASLVFRNAPQPSGAAATSDAMASSAAAAFTDTIPNTDAPPEAKGVMEY